MEEHPLSDYMSGGWLTEVLIDGKWINYDQCDDSRKPESLIPGAAYLGKSKEVRLKGITQEPMKKPMYFWKIKE
ncbi:hypothetical protein HQ531_12140 [bacterium]|nr:hypothetical protein [bacterium]